MSAAPDTRYNGWTNRATWNVNLWLSNDEASYRRVQRHVDYLKAEAPEGYEPDEHTFAEWLERHCKGLWTSGRTPDGCPLSEVNWLEVAEAWLD